MDDGVQAYEKLDKKKKKMAKERGATRGTILEFERVARG